MGVNIARPDFRYIEVNPTVVSKDSISIGLVNLKGMGRKNAEAIIEKRNEMNSFELSDILSSGIPPASLELMAQVGMFDYLDIRRFEIVNIIDGNKIDKEKMSDSIMEKEEMIENLYQKLAQESGLDINTVKLYDYPPKGCNISDNVYLNRIKEIDKIKNDRQKVIKKLNEKIS